MYIKCQKLKCKKIQKKNINNVHNLKYHHIQ